MRKWVLWLLTVALLLAGLTFLMWALQTAWLGSFPGKDKQKYAIWAALLAGESVVCVIASIMLWIKQWRCKSK